MAQVAVKAEGPVSAKRDFNLQGHVREMVSSTRPARWVVKGGILRVRVLVTGNLILLAHGAEKGWGRDL